MSGELHQAALDVVSLARAGGMPETYWTSDARIARACDALGITPEAARALPDDVYLTGLPEQDPAPASDAVTAAAPNPVRVPVALEVWTDGACAGNPGPGGWGWITNEEPDESGEARSGFGGEASTTNQRMEVQAALEALRAVGERPVVVVSDSRYVVDCFAKKWHVGWAKRNWLNSQGKPVANRDLWEQLIPLATADGVSFRWVKGHAGFALNEAADQLAVRGRDQASAARASRPRRG